MEKCKSVYDGMLAGFMCMRKPNHKGRHLWWLKGNRNPSKNGIYWTDARDSFMKKVKAHA